MNVYVIIIHFGDPQVTRSCIEQLLKYETYPFTLLVVNNTLDTFQVKKSTKRKVIVMDNKKNLGFAGGVNVGIRYALKKHADIVCLLNNDTYFEKPFLGKLVKGLSIPSIGIVGPSIRFKKNGKQIFDMGGKLNTWFLRTSHEEVERITSLQTKNVTYVSGCCMMIKKSVFETIGLFDESFFLYFEDVDFCLRAKEKGFITQIVPSAIIGHLLSESVGNMSKLSIQYLLKSAIIFGKKYSKNPIQKILNKLFILFQSLLFLKANPDSGLVIARILLQFSSSPVLK